MRKIFLDCGAHRGQSVRFFRKTYTDADQFEIYCFEPNDKLKGFFENLGVTHIDKIVWKENTILPFYQIRDGKHPGASLASSVFKEKSGPGTNIYERFSVKNISRFKRIQARYERYARKLQDRKKHIARKQLNRLKVPQGKTVEKKAIDFSSWIIENFNPSNLIILKLDIEGAEYAVLEKMLEDNSIDYINKLFIEWHHDKLNGAVTEEQHNKIIEALEERNLILIDWNSINKSDEIH